MELAALPTTTPEERKRLLSFVICGGGPTGVEFAAELRDMMAEDVLKYVSFYTKEKELIKVPKTPRIRSQSYRRPESRSHP